MTQNILGTLFILAVIAITAIVVVRRIRNIKDVEPDLEVMNEQFEEGIENEADTV